MRGTGVLPCLRTCLLARLLRRLSFLIDRRGAERIFLLHYSLEWFVGGKGDTTLEFTEARPRALVGDFRKQASPLRVVVSAYLKPSTYKTLVDPIGLLPSVPEPITRPILSTSSGMYILA